MNEIKSLQIIIRPVQQTDLELVYSIDQSSFNAIADTGVIANTFVTIRQMFDTAKNCFFVAELDHKIIGYSVGCIEFASEYGWLLDVAVLKDKQGFGYGKQLAKKVIDTLLEAGVRKIRLVVAPNNKNAVILYQKLGFSKELHEKNYYGNGERIVMVYIANTNL